jgi:O-antigen/teichoic acid export membrane protein
MSDQRGLGEGRRSARRTFLLNALTSYGQSALLALSALLLTPYLFRELGTGGFGTWSVMFTLTTVFNMLEVGFAQGTTKFIAEHRATGERARAEATIGASTVLNVGFGLVALAISLVLALLASGLAAPDETEDFRSGMVILGFAFLLRFPLVTYGAVLAGYQRYDLYNTGLAVTVIGSALGSVVAVAAGAGVLGVAIAYAAGFVAGGISHLALLKRLDSGLRLLPRRGDRAARSTVLGFNSFTLLADSMMFVGARMDTVVIAAIRNAAAAAPFAAATKLQSGLQALTLPVVNLMLPMISELDARGRRDDVIRRLVLATRLSLQVTIPVAVGVAFFSADIVDAWLGPEAPSVTASIVTVMALQSLMLCAVPADKVLIGVGRARTVGLLNTVEGLSNLAISIVLVSAYGAIGAAIGTLVSSYLIGPPKFALCCSATGYHLRRFIRISLLGAVASSLPSVAAIVVVWLVIPLGVGRMALGFALGLGVAAVVGLLQVGPRRAAAELRGSGTAGRESEPLTPPAVAQDPA